MREAGKYTTCVVFGSCPSKNMSKGAHETDVAPVMGSAKNVTPFPPAKGPLADYVRSWNDQFWKGGKRPPRWSAR